VHDTITVHTPAADGSVKIDQQVTSVDFTLFGMKQPASIPADALSSALSHMNGKVTPHANKPVADADLSIEAATFTIPIGSLMLEAAGPLLFNQFGGATDLNGALNNLVPCASFGQTLADNSGGALDNTVGTKLCTAALGIVAAGVTLELSKVTLDSVLVDGATAKLYDTSMKVPVVDHQSDRLAEGVWNWHFTVSGGTAVVPSSFSGDRTGTAN
jgi:hypothetical protein